MPAAIASPQRRSANASERGEPANLADEGGEHSDGSSDDGDDGEASSEVVRYAFRAAPIAWLLVEYCHLAADDSPNGLLQRVLDAILRSLAGRRDRNTKVSRERRGRR